MPHLDSYQIEREGLTLGDGTDYDIVGLEGTGMPDVRDIDVNRLDDDGAFPTREERVGRRSWGIHLWVLGQPGIDMDQKLTALKKAFQKDNDPKPLYFNMPLGFGAGETGDDTRMITGFVRRRSDLFQQQSAAWQFPVDIMIDCPDPRVYEETLRTFVVGTSVTDVGRTYPRVYPLTYEEGQSGIQIASNYGTIDTFPSARIDGPCTSPRIENVTTGRSLRLRSELSAGEFLEVDFANRDILLNGTANRYYEKVLASEFFPVVPGDNSIRFSAEAFQEGAELTFRWRSAWL